ncbi:Uncharacterised protein [uncultured archaeon]|nr:Uncharacterised protein [uncultured archaeon]
MFVRTKTISGRTYYYLVENKRINGKVRQKVLEYIGPTAPKPEAVEEIKRRQKGAKAPQTA